MWWDLTENVRFQKVPWEADAAGPRPHFRTRYAYLGIIFPINKMKQGTGWSLKSALKFCEMNNLRRQGDGNRITLQKWERLACCVDSWDRTRKCAARGTTQELGDWLAIDPDWRRHWMTVDPPAGQGWELRIPSEAAAANAFAPPARKW